MAQTCVSDIIAIAFALLPYGHTVFDRSTGAVDRERTRQILILHRLVYGLPYYILLIAFMFTSFLFVVGLGEVNAPDPSMGSLGSLGRFGRSRRGEDDDDEELEHPEGGGDVDDDDDVDDVDDVNSRVSSGKGNVAGMSSRAELVRKSYEEIRSTLGFYFYHSVGASRSPAASVRVSNDGSYEGSYEGD